MANAKTPPSWSPELEASYPLWVYAQDLILWSAATEVPIARQGPAAVLQLGGMARVLGREMNVDELSNGRQEWDYTQQQMLHVTGITILLRNLLRRFGELDEEQSIRLLSQLLGFSRMQGESIDQALSRFDITVYRATNLLQNFALGPQGLAWILLRALKVAPVMWSQLLIPLNGQLPTTEDQMNILKRHIRQQAHILEHHPHG
eukprot:1831548-Pyramimonas_sp.AAC.1